MQRLQILDGARTAEVEGVLANADVARVVPLSLRNMCELVFDHGALPQHRASRGRLDLFAEAVLQLQHRLRKQIQTPAGRAVLRERTMIEHKLAHISQRQGNHARYVGIRKNTFDLRRASAIQNLETLHRSEVESRKAA